MFNSEIRINFAAKMELVCFNTFCLRNQFFSSKEMFKTIDEDDDNRLDAGELLVMVSAAMETEIGADLQTAKEVLEGARDEFGEFTQLHVLST